MLIRKLKCVVIVITMENIVDIVVKAIHHRGFYFIKKPVKLIDLLLHYVILVH